MKPWEMEWGEGSKDKKPWEMDYSSAGKPAMEHQTYQRIRPVQPEGGGLDFLRGLKEGVFDIGRGAQQRVAEVRSLGGNNVEDKNKLYEEEAARRENREFNPEVTASEKAGRAVGMFGTTLPLAFLPGGQTTLSSTLMSLLSGGLAGAAFPTTSGNETLANIGAGAGGQALGNLGARLFLPTTARNMSQAQKDILDAAKAERIPLRTSEATGSNVIKNWEQMRANRPITGGMEERFNKAQTEAINRAVTRRLGSDAKGASREVSEINDDLLLSYRNDIGSEVSGIVKGKDVPLDTDFFVALIDVDRKSNVGRKLTSSPAIRAKIDDALDLIINQPKVKGEVAQEIRSDLLDQARDARLADNNSLARGLERLAEGLRDAMKGTLNSSDRARWVEANRQYANYKIIEEAFIKNKKALAQGDVPIEKLATVMEQHTPLSYVHGKGEFSDLAKLGQVIKPPGRSALLGETMVPFPANPNDYIHGAAYPVLQSKLMQRYLTGGFPGQRAFRDIPGLAENTDALMRSAGLSLLIDKENFR